MNVYEEAHNLSKAIKESEEYKQYRDIANKVKENPELDKMLKDFMDQQMQVQARQMTGQEVGPEMIESIQKLTTIVMADPLAAEYLQTQMRLSVMIQDIYKILGDAIAF
ncbi:MAG: YlbF family regulator [Eubacteriales bacterium]|nr:YlbF family regulator [Eubacteriales bacterium]MDY3332809.1 YlbF family regulator [Gallibacter sp.]